MNRGLIKAYTLAGIIASFRLAAWGASDGVVKQATGPNDAPVGVVNDITGADGDLVDITRTGIAPVKFGDTITRGQNVTSDSQGRAVPAVDRIYTTVIAGGAAGALTVTGIKTTDTLIAVVRINKDATAANIDAEALTSEFSITAADTISNVGGTVTTGDKLIVTYQRKDRVYGRAEVSGVVGDVGDVMLSPA